jgi:hypothetical protein
MKIYRTTLSEVKKLVKEQTKFVGDWHDAWNAANGTGEIDDLIIQLKETIKFNLKEYCQDNDYSSGNVIDSIVEGAKLESSYQDDPAMILLKQMYEDGDV